MTFTDYVIIHKQLTSLIHQRLPVSSSPLFQSPLIFLHISPHVSCHLYFHFLLSFFPSFPRYYFNFFSSLPIVLPIFPFLSFLLLIISCLFPVSSCLSSHLFLFSSYLSPSLFLYFHFFLSFFHSSDFFLSFSTLPVFHPIFFFFLLISSCHSSYISISSF